MKSLLSTVHKNLIEGTRVIGGSVNVGPGDVDVKV